MLLTGDCCNFPGALVEHAASCLSPDFETFKSLTKVNPSPLLRTEAAFYCADPTLAGEELWALVSVCPPGYLPIPFYILLGGCCTQYASLGAKQ